VTAISTDRRGFLVSASVCAGGMAIGLRPAQTSAAAWAADDPVGGELSAWIVIAPDDTVTIRVPKPEMGNGVVTQIAMNVAEELCCDWANVRTEIASIHRDYLEDSVYAAGPFPYASGNSTESAFMRHTMQLGASARERLKGAAAQRWNVPAIQVEARSGVLTDPVTGRSLRFGQVAAEAARIELAEEPKLKSPGEWTLIGKQGTGKLGLDAIVTGRTVYGIDVQVPGMVHAAILQVPVHGGRLRRYDPVAVMEMPGVRAVVVVDPSATKGSPLKPRSTYGMATTRAQWAIAVIADHYWQAKKGLDALPVEWDLGPGADWRSSEAIAEARDAVLDRADGKVVAEAGDPGAVAGGTLVEASYSTPLCDHATIEPLNGTALVTQDGAEVWAPTQDLAQAYWTVIDETGLVPEKVRLHVTNIGGGFGRRTQADDVRMVVAVARQYPGVPVKVIWSREETMRQGRYRSPIMTRFKARLNNATGLPEAVIAETNITRPVAPLPGEPDYFEYVKLFGFADMPYFVSGAIPNFQLRASELPLHVLTGPYRGPFYNAHSFITETFIDECAVAAGMDPLGYRLQLLATWDKSWSDCLRVAAEKAGWGQRLPKGEGLGIAISAWPLGGQRNIGTVAAMVARVAVDTSGQIAVRQVDAAFDCGRVANPDGVRKQLEGGIIYGLNAALNEEISIADGAVLESNFHDFPVLRIGEVPPRINVHFEALSDHERFATVGEVGDGPIGPAVGNAIFAATGRRLRSTPFRKHFPN